MEGETSAVPPLLLPRSSPAPLPYLPHLDGLRAVALVLVLAYHFKVPGAGGGYVGVDIFLVLSGFLMTRTIQGARAAGTFHLRSWYASRFWRLYPAALVTSAAAVAAAAVLFPPALASRTGASAAAAAGLVANVYFWSQEGYFDVASAAKPLLHMWSLSLEEQFYAIYPAALVLLGLPWRWRLPADISRGWKVETKDGAAAEGDGEDGNSSAIGGGGAPLDSRARMVAAVGVASAVSLAQPFLSSLRSSGAMAGASAAFFLLPARVWEFGAGAGVALLYPSGLSPGRLSEAVAAVGAMSVLGAAAYLRAGQYPVSAALPAVAGTAALISSPSSLVARRVLALPAARAIGRLSYAAYLVHWPAYVFGAYVATAMRAAWMVHPATMIAITAVAAAALHWWVEVPMRRVAKDDIRAVRRRWAWMAVTAAVTTALVGGCVVTDGWAVIKASASGLTVEQGRAAMRERCVDLPYEPTEEGKLSEWYSVGCIVSPGEGVAATIAANATLSHPPPVDAMVVGNSFARHLLGGLAVATSPGQVLVVSYRGGCTFTTLRRFDRVANTQEPGCRSFVASQWALLERLPANTTVMVANDWTTSRGFLHSAAAAAEIVAALRKMRLDPVVVGPSPAMAHPDKDALFPCYDLRRYILWPSWLSLPMGAWSNRGGAAGGAGASLCPQTYHPRPETLAAHNDLLTAAAVPPTAAATAFRYVDLMGAACSQATAAASASTPAVSADLTCPVGEVDPVSGAYVLYYEPDGYHLTAYGSAAAAGPLRTVLATATRPLSTRA
ncbi:hypothetical protein MMPV_000977 [Pyropia vietnamensis]